VLNPSLVENARHTSALGAGISTSNSSALSGVDCFTTLTGLAPNPDAAIINKTAALIEHPPDLVDRSSKHDYP
jgi:hypothetical protein